MSTPTIESNNTTAATVAPATNGTTTTTTTTNNTRSTLKVGAANFTQSCLAFLQRSLTIRKWIESILGESINEKETLFEAIRDGVLLCRVMMIIRQDSIPKIHTGTKLNFKIRENLLFFLQALEDLGVSRYYIFQVTDLIERKNDIKVLESLEVFGDIAGEIDKSKAIQQLPEDSPIPFSDAEITEAERVLKKLNITQLKRQPCTKSLFANEPSANLSSSTSNANKHRSLTTSQISNNKFITPSGPRPKPSLSPAQIIQKAKPFEKKWIRIQALVRGHLQRKQFHRRVRNAAYRHNIVKEILSTEEIYVKNLAHLSKYYFEPIQENTSKLNIKPEHLKQMFSNIEVIKNYNNKFLEDLRPIIENWSHFQKIGHIFSQFILLLKVYTQYVKEYTQSYEVLNNYRKNNSKFESFITEKEAADGKSINDYLILPVQRIPRYTLLLADLVKNTWKDHKDYNDLTESLKTMQEVATYVNEKKREAENIQKVTEIQNNFVGKFENLAEPHRRFVYEGNLHIISPNGKESPRIIYLFNDVLVGTKPTTSGLVKRKDHLKVKESIRMNLITIRNRNQPNQQQQQQQETKQTDQPSTPTPEKTNPTPSSSQTSSATQQNGFVTAKPSVTSSKPPASGATPPYNKPAPPKPPPRSSSNTGVNINVNTPPHPQTSTFKPATHSSNIAPTQQYLRQSAPPSTTSVSSKPPLNASDPGLRNRTSTNSPSGIAPLPRPRTITTTTPTTTSTNNITTSTNNTSTQSSNQQPTTTSSSTTNNNNNSTVTTTTANTTTESTTNNRDDLIIELCDSFGTCILKILCNSAKERECWVNEFKKVKEDLENRKIVNEEAMKRSQERAGIAKAALSQQYATLRIKGRLYGQSEVKSALEDGSESSSSSSSSPSSPSVGSAPSPNGASTTGDRDFSILRRQTMRRSQQQAAGADSPPTLSLSSSSAPTSISSVSPKGSKEDLTDNSDDNSTKSKSRWFASLRSKKKKPSSSTLIQDAFSQPLEPLNGLKINDDNEENNNTTVIVKEDEAHNNTTNPVVVKEK